HRKHLAVCRNAVLLFPGIKVTWLRHFCLVCHMTRNEGRYCFPLWRFGCCACCDASGRFASWVLHAVTILVAITLAGVFIIMAFDVAARTIAVALSVFLRA